VVEDSAETAAQVAAEGTLVDAGETTAQPPYVDAAQSDDAVIADVDGDGAGDGAGPSGDGGLPEADLDAGENGDVDASSGGDE
jgi:hypothetical protein